MATLPIQGFEEFIEVLTEELNLLQKAGDFTGAKRLDDLMTWVDDMLWKKIAPRIKITTRISASALRSHLSSFYDDFFDGDPREVMTTLKHGSGNFFSFKCAYQLSHSRGVWQIRIEEANTLSNDIKEYFLSRIFSDAYEILPLLISPIMEFHCHRKGRAIMTKTSNCYETLAEIFPKSIFYCIHKEDQFRQLRNGLSHAQLMFEGEAIISWKPGSLPKRIPPMYIFPVMEAMMNAVVVYATALDLRILGMAKTGDNRIFKNWMMYFENYVRWFQKVYEVKKLAPAP